MRQYSEEELKLAREHRDVLLNLRAVLTTDQGKEFIKYLFRHLEVGQFPQPGMEPLEQAEVLGKLRAGNAIFKLVSEADHGIAGVLLAQIEKERYVELTRQHEQQEKIERGDG